MQGANGCLPADRRPSGIAVEAVSLAKCGTVTDAVVSALCSTLPTLRCVDVSRCSQVTDASLRTLARYRRDGSGEGASNTREGGTSPEFLMQSLAVGGDTGRARFALETPEKAVRRVAAQHAQQQRWRLTKPAEEAVGGGLEELRLVGTAVSSGAVAALLHGPAKAPSLRLLDVSRCDIHEHKMLRCFVLLLSVSDYLPCARPSAVPRSYAVFPQPAILFTFGHAGAFCWVAMRLSQGPAPCCACCAPLPALHFARSPYSPLSRHVWQSCRLRTAGKSRLAHSCCSSYLSDVQLC